MTVLEDSALGRELVSNAQEKAQRYDWQNVAAQLLNYYEAVIERAVSPAAQPEPSFVS